MADKYYTAKAIANILDEYANSEEQEVFDSQADNIDAEATYIANRLKFYEMEMDLQDFCENAHTLKEWASYGINKVVYDGKEYYDGKNFDGTPITDEQSKEYGLLEMDYWDTDENGYKYIVLKKAEEE